MRGVNSSPFEYSSQSDGEEVWFSEINSSISLDKPRTIDGARLSLAGSGNLIIQQNGPAGDTTFSVSADDANGDAQLHQQSLAMKNLLLRTGSLSNLQLECQYSQGNLTSGSISFATELLSVLPFLPDPYTGNISSFISNETSLGNMTVKVTWDSTLNQLPSFDLSLPDNVLQNVSLLNEGDDTITLLDLSTNVSQFGVFLPILQPQTQAADLYMQVQLAEVTVIALPAVQWEPIVSEPAGDTYDFTEAGPMTSIKTTTVDLVPVAPREVLDGIINAYSTSTSAAVLAGFSLPFGYRARPFYNTVI